MFFKNRAVFTRTALMIRLFENRLVLSSAQRGAGSKKDKSVNLNKIFVYTDFSKLQNAKNIYKRLNYKLFNEFLYENDFQEIKESN